MSLNLQMPKWKLKFNMCNTEGKKKVFQSKAKWLLRRVLFCIMITAQKYCGRSGIWSWLVIPSYNHFSVFSFSLKSLGDSVKYCYVLSQYVVEKDKVRKGDRDIVDIQKLVTAPLPQASRKGYYGNCILYQAKQRDGQSRGKAFHICHYRCWRMRWRSLHSCVLQAVVTFTEQGKGEIKIV